MRSSGGYASPPATRNVESDPRRRRHRADHDCAFTTRVAPAGSNTLTLVPSVPDNAETPTARVALSKGSVQAGRDHLGMFRRRQNGVLVARAGRRARRRPMRRRCRQILRRRNAGRERWKSDASGLTEESWPEGKSQQSLSRHVRRKRLIFGIFHPSRRTAGVFFCIVRRLLTPPVPRCPQISRATFLSSSALALMLPYAVVNHTYPIPTFYAEFSALGLYLLPGAGVALLVFAGAAARVVRVADDRADAVAVRAVAGGADGACCRSRSRR